MPALQSETYLIFTKQETAQAGIDKINENLGLPKIDACNQTIARWNNLKTGTLDGTDYWHFCTPNDDGIVIENYLTENNLPDEYFIPIADLPASWQENNKVSDGNRNYPGYTPLKDVVIEFVAWDIPDSWLPANKLQSTE